MQINYIKFDEILRRSLEADCRYAWYTSIEYMLKPRKDLREKKSKGGFFQSLPIVYNCVSLWNTMDTNDKSSFVDISAIFFVF